MKREINSDELNFFYQKSGEAIWHLQYVETFLTKFYFIKAIAKIPNSVGNEKANIHMSELETKTLGQLIRLIENGNIAPIEFINRLKQFNEKRKWVVHNSNREDGHKLYTDEGRSYFVEEIRGFTDFAISLQKEIEQMMMEYALSLDIDKEEIFSNAKKIIDNFKGNV